MKIDYNSTNIKAIPIEIEI